MTSVKSIVLALTLCAPGCMAAFEGCASDDDYVLKTGSTAVCDVDKYEMCSTSKNGCCEDSLDGKCGRWETANTCPVGEQVAQADKDTAGSTAAACCTNMTCASLGVAKVCEGFQTTKNSSKTASDKCMAGVGRNQENNTCSNICCAEITIDRRCDKLGVQFNCDTTHQAYHVSEFDSLTWKFAADTTVGKFKTDCCEAKTCATLSGEANVTCAEDKTYDATKVALKPATADDAGFKATCCTDKKTCRLLSGSMTCNAATTEYDMSENDQMADSLTETDFRAKCCKAYRKCGDITDEICRDEAGIVDKSGNKVVPPAGSVGKHVSKGAEDLYKPEGLKSKWRSCCAVKSLTCLQWGSNGMTFEPNALLNAAATKCTAAGKSLAFDKLGTTPTQLNADNCCVSSAKCSDITKPTSPSPSGGNGAASSDAQTLRLSASVFAAGLLAPLVFQ